MQTYLTVAVAGVLGCWLRLFLGNFIPTFAGRAFPWATLTINILGSFLMGFLFVATAERFALSQPLRVGILTGFLSFVPFVGILTGFLLALGLGLVKFGLGARIVAVLGVFAVGAFCESNVLSPRLVGGRVNLHPVWIIFALLAFAQLFGFLGVLIALPASAVLLVGIRRARAGYMASRLYQG